MKIIPVYLEFVEMIMACKTIVEKDDLNEKSNQKEICDFRNLVEQEGSWSTRVFVKSSRELANCLILFSEFPEFPGSIVPMEESIKNIYRSFGDRMEPFLKGLLVSAGKFDEGKFKDLISKNSKAFTNLIEKDMNLSDDSIWLLNQIIDFPDHAREILKHIFDELKNFYDKSGLRVSNMKVAKESASTFSPEEHLRFSEKILEYYRIFPEPDKPIYILFQNITDIKIPSLHSFSDIQYIIVGNEMEVREKIMYPLIPEHSIRGLLKSLADSTKFQILVSISEEPRYVDELAKLLGLSKATISYHLSALSNLDIVLSEKRDRRIYFSLNTKKLNLLLNGLESLFDTTEGLQWK